MAINQEYKLGDQVRHVNTGSLGVVCGFPTEFDEKHVSVKWHADGGRGWPAGYVTRVKDIEKTG